MLSYISDLISGLKHLQKNGIIHRKLQPNTIFLSYHQSLVIGGLELNIERNNKEKVINDDINYIPPEILMDSSVKYTEENVIYSLGCVIYELYTLNRVNNGFHTIDVNKIEFSRYNLPRIMIIEELIVKMLDKIPTNRIKLDEIEELLNSNKNDNTSIESNLHTEQLKIKTIKEISEKNEYEKDLIKDFDVFI